MSALTASMAVSITDQVVWVRISGRANFTASVDFRALIHGLHREGFGRFIFDLTDCLIMDSTFLGVLAGFGAALERPQPERNGNCVQLLNPNARVSALLDNLGVSHLFNVATRTDAGGVEFKPVAASETAPSKEQVSRTCLEAHQTLMDINPNNVAKFKDVAKFLAEDLKRMQKKASEPGA